MSKTLFWYIFKDLFLKFSLASGALAGIMSFGGILRPLTKQGLGLSEAVAVLLSLMPAMSTYSFPIAALFATTLVYGRMTQDNEIVAIRAGGISYLAAAIPAIVLGFIVALTSIGMLCFVVPSATRNVEAIIYSNVGRVLATSIERTHEFSADRSGPTLSAQGAVLLPPDPAEPGVQTVVLDSPLIIRSGQEEAADGTKLSIPKEFMTAKKATIKIRPIKETEQVDLTVYLEGGVAFPRQTEKAQIGAVASTMFKPEPIASMISEKTKFMDLKRLHELRSNPESDRRVHDAVQDINLKLQQLFIYNNLQAGFQAADRSYSFDEPNGDRHTIKLTNPAWDPRTDFKTGKDLSFDVLNSGVHYETTRPGSGVIEVVDAKGVSVLATPSANSELVQIDLNFDNATTQMGPKDRPLARDKFRRTFTLPAPDSIKEIATRRAVSHLNDTVLDPTLMNKLKRALIITNNEVWGELNSRMSFAVSCLVLVLMGVALGMMFRSGSFLTAFAVSVGPALVCILLTVTGQHTLEAIPRVITGKWVNPLPLGITMIWAGNLAVLVAATALLYRLQKR